MSDVLVACITKLPRSDMHEAITHLGNAGARWRWPRGDIIASIAAGTNTFFVLAKGRRLNIVVVEGANGKYVQAEADGVLTPDLLALPDCPAKKAPAPSLEMTRTRGVAKGPP